MAGEQLAIPKTVQMLSQRSVAICFAFALQLNNRIHCKVRKWHILTQNEFKYIAERGKWRRTAPCLKRYFGWLVLCCN